MLLYDLNSDVSEDEPDPSAEARGIDDDSDSHLSAKEDVDYQPAASNYPLSVSSMDTVMVHQSSFIACQQQPVFAR